MLGGAGGAGGLMEGGRLGNRSDYLSLQQPEALQLEQAAATLHAGAITHLQEECPFIKLTIISCTLCILLIYFMMRKMIIFKSDAGIKRVYESKFLGEIVDHQLC